METIEVSELVKSAIDAIKRKGSRYAEPAIVFTTDNDVIRFLLNIADSEGYIDFE